MLGPRGAGAPTTGKQHMTTRSKGPGAGFGWLSQGISVAFNHPKPLFGGAALLVVAALLPSLITLPIQFYSMRTGTPPSTTTFFLIMAISMLFHLLLVPLYAGYLQMVDAAERELPVSAFDIFKPYRQGDAFRLMGYGLATIVVYVALFGIVIVTIGRHVAQWYMELLTAQASHQAPPTTLPEGFGTVIALFMVVALFMTAFYAISLGQVALSRRNVFGAIGDGMIGALKNLLPLLVFLVVCILAWIVFAVVLVIVALVLGFIAKLISYWLVFVVLVPLYIAMLLLIFAVTFGVMYYLWRDVCGDDVAVAMPPPLAA
jgi:hypothetical protein